MISLVVAKWSHLVVVEMCPQAEGRLRGEVDEARGHHDGARRVVCVVVKLHSPGKSSRERIKVCAISYALRPGGWVFREFVVKSSNLYLVHRARQYM